MLFRSETGGAIPTAADGEAAAEVAARDEPLALGRVGAGVGTTVGKWKGRHWSVPGGVGVASTHVDGATLAALAVVNAIGDVIGADGRVVAGATAPDDAVAFPPPEPFEQDDARGNTTLVTLVTDAVCDKMACQLLSHSAHDGFARALHPSHTRYDGDLAIVVSTGVVEAHFDRLRVAAADVVADAIRASCQ